LSRPEHAFEAHADHEHRSQDGHVARGRVAHLVVDPEPAVALQAAEGLLDLPAPGLDLEALAPRSADDLGGDAVALEEGSLVVAGGAAVEPSIRSAPRHRPASAGRS
jgi:hypothetical protein